MRGNLERLERLDPQLAMDALGKRAAEPGDPLERAHRMTTQSIERRASAGLDQLDDDGRKPLSDVRDRFEPDAAVIAKHVAHLAIVLAHALRTVAPCAHAMR